MTNAEAKKIIKSRCYFTSVLPDTKEALDMAIEALSVIEDIKAEIEANVESIIGKYDSNTKPEDMPSRKIERNHGRMEAIDIINRKIAEVTKNE